MIGRQSQYLIFIEKQVLMEKGENPDNIYPTYFNNPTLASLAVLVIANGEMTVEETSKVIGGFKTPKLKNQFAQKRFNYENHLLYGQQFTPENQSLNHVFIHEYEEYIKCFKPDPKAFTEHLLNTGIHATLISKLFSIKKRLLEQQEEEGQEMSSKEQKLISLINAILQKYGEEANEQLARKIVNYGGIQAVYNEEVFAGNVNLRNKFKNILYNCQTFKVLKQYGGADILYRKSQLIKAISKCLINLSIKEDVAQQIRDGLIKDPTSNIVANSKKLANEEKRKYYKSQFYLKDQLKAYAQIFEYKNSVEYQAKEEVGKILRAIQESSKVTSQILQNVLNYDLYKLLRISSLRSVKRSVFQVIKNCSNYLKAFKMKHQNKQMKAQKLRQNFAINRKFDLVKVFLSIQLPFEEWEQAQTSILDKNYSVVDTLKLDLQGKNTLFTHIFNQLEPSFHAEDSVWDYQNQIKFKLLELLMETDISEASFSLIEKIIEETVSKQNGFKSHSIEELSKGNKKQYELVLKNEQFVCFVKSQGKNVKEEQYNKSLALKKQIYEINFENQVTVLYKHVHEFVHKVISQGGMPAKYPRYITDLSKLNNSQQTQVVEIEPEPEPEPQPQPEKKQVVQALDPTALRKQFEILAVKLADTFMKGVQQSKFQQYLQEPFNNDKVEYVRKIIQTSAFENEASSFFTDLKKNSILTKQVKRQFQQNKKLVEGQLAQCKAILDKLKSISLSPPSSPLKPRQPSNVTSPISISASPVVVDKRALEQQFQACANQFVKKYIDDQEFSTFCGAFEKNESNNVKFVKKIIQTNALDNPASTFYTDLGINGLLTKRTIKQFIERKAAILELIGRCVDIFPQIR